MITVKTKRAHENGFGSSYAKKVGDEYDAPAQAAQGLKADGLVSFVDAKAAKAELALHNIPDEAEAVAATGAAKA